MRDGMRKDGVTDCGETCCVGTDWDAKYVADEEVAGADCVVSNCRIPDCIEAAWVEGDRDGYVIEGNELDGIGIDVSLGEIEEEMLEMVGGLTHTGMITIIWKFGMRELQLKLCICLYITMETKLGILRWMTRRGRKVKKDLRKKIWVIL